MTGSRGPNDKGPLLGIPVWGPALHSEITLQCRYLAVAVTPN